MNRIQRKAEDAHQRALGKGSPIVDASPHAADWSDRSQGTGSEHRGNILWHLSAFPAS